jgi:putative oxidoreductase
MKTKGQRLFELLIFGYIRGMSGLVTRWNKFLDSSMRETFDALSLLALRLICGGGLAMIHGWPKLNNFSSLSTNFPDPLHTGSPTLSLMLTIFGELVCGILVAIGFFTRLFVIPAFVSIAVTIVVLQADAPYDKKELAFLYLAGFFVLLLRGSGPLSFDGLLSKSAPR